MDPQSPAQKGPEAQPDLWEYLPGGPAWLHGLLLQKTLSSGIAVQCYILQGKNEELKRFSPGLCG